MTERVGVWSAVPVRRGEAVPGAADPPVGRHALDHEAGLTPIFTSLRRDPRRPPHVRALRPVVDPVEQFRRDPQTAPIPIVPALYAVGSPPPAPVAPRVPEPSPNEVTMCWSRGPETSGSWGGPGWTTHDPSHDPGYGHQVGGYDAGYETAGYETGVHASGGYHPGYETAGYETDGYGSGGYEAVGYDPRGYPPHPDPRAYLRQDPYAYDPLTDSGRHHHRLAPAGW